jgi:outer membrane receptor protein involved in Fe transport
VIDRDTGDPLPFASVVVVGTSRGASTGDDGTYRIRGVPDGVHTIQASYIGYTPVRHDSVVVETAATITVDFGLPLDLTTFEEVMVFGDRPLVDVRNTSSIKTLSAQDIEDLTIEPTLEALIGQQVGVTMKDGEIHIRGGRADETMVLVDGVPLKDATGGSTVANALSAGSAAEVSVVKGGWDAKYGQAISGIVDVRVKEGTPRFRGEMSYITDQILADENLHYVSLQVEGPNPILDPVADVLGLDRAQPATFHLDLSTELSDTYLPSIRDLSPGARHQSSYKGHILGSSFDYGDFFRPSGDNNWRITAKTGWTVHPAHKLTATYVKSLQVGGLFQATDIGDVNRNITSYPWNWSPRLDHHYTITSDFYLLSLQWKHSLSDQSFHQLRFKHRFTGNHRDVAGQHWSEYERPRDAVLDAEGLGHPYFLDTGDAPDYRDRYSEMIGLDWEYGHSTDHHDISLGLEGQYEDVQYFTLDAYTVDERNPLGQEFDLFHVYPAQGAIYLQDRIEYPGINLKVSLRGDVFFPGAQVERLYEEQNRLGFNAATAEEWDDSTHEIFDRRYKLRWSPRLAVSHPISDSSHFFFNYGRFTQWPTYFYLYAKTGGVSSEEFPRIGNPNLEPEVSAQYEFGVGHKFNDRLSLRTTMFFKDIYDYPTSIAVDIGTRSTRRQTFFLYRNLDYARSRGVEVELQKRRRKHVWASASYSYSVATGKSSNPSALAQVQAVGGDARETDLDEQFMWWNRPHKVTLSWGYQVDASQAPPKLLGWTLPRRWKLSAYWMMQSGEAYTPESFSGAEVGKAFSRNGPLDTVLDLDFAKEFTVLGRELSVQFNVRNLLNHRTVLEIDPVTGTSPQAGLGSYYRDNQNPQTLYLNEAELAGADVSVADFGIRNENDAVLYTMFDTRNPAYLSAPRSIRMGITYAW